MKIAHLLGWYFPDSFGGTEIYVEYLCRRLRAAGHDVAIAAPTTNGGPVSYTHDSVPVFRYAIPTDATRDEACTRVPVRGTDALYRWLDEQRPDVLHVHSFCTAVGLHEIREAHRLGIRVIATCHLPGFGYMCRAGELMRWGCEPCDGVVEARKCAACNLVRVGVPRLAAEMIASLPPGSSAVFGRVPGPLGTVAGMAASVAEYQSMQRELLDLVDRFVVLNETARRMLVANGSSQSKIVVNRLGVAREIVRPKPGPVERPTPRLVRFGYVGRLHESKGLHTLVGAVRAISANVPFTLSIRGPVLDEATRTFVGELRNLAGDDPRVRFDAAISRGQIAAALADFDALVCPSTWFENGPTVALEAHAVGTPVLGSNVGNLGEIIDHDVTGLLIAPGDVGAWSRALTMVAKDPAATIDRWRVQLPSVRTMDDVADDYLSMYGAA